MKRAIASIFILSLVSAHLVLAQVDTKLTATDATPGANFGQSVAISGNVAVIGSPNNGSSGSVHVFTFGVGNSVQDTTLVADDIATGNEFGHSVAISDSFIVVGVPKRNAAYVFEFNGQNWVQIAKLDSAVSGQFGHSVAISGDFIVVGAPDSNAAYVFKFDDENWRREQKLAAEPGDKFGFSVAIKGKFIAVGAPGRNAVYVFNVDEASKPVEIIIDSTSAAGDMFGYAVDISNDGKTLVIGVPFKKYQGDISGASYLYNLSSGNMKKLLEESPGMIKAGDNFGWSAAISGNFIIVGAPFHDDNQRLDSGAAFKFIYRKNEWQFERKLTPSEYSAPRDHFGWAVAIGENSDYTIVGAPQDDDKGSASVFDLNQPPYVKKPIPDTTLTFGGLPFVTNLVTVPVFADSDTLDSLTFSATSLDSNVAVGNIFNNSTLTVALANPAADDTTIIIVTATDIEKESAKDTFTVFVNFPPYVENPIPETMLRLGWFDSFQINLTKVFNDSDDVDLRFNIISNSNASVASTELSGDLLSVVAKAVDSTKITVSADDNRGGLIDTSFTVIVRENQPPIVVSEIDEIVFSSECEEFTRDLSESQVVFSDPDGDPLTQLARSLNSNVARATLSGDILRVRRVSKMDGDTTTVVLTAVDVCGAATSTSIPVRIDNSNRSPAVTDSISNAILTIGDTLCYDLNMVFDDPDDDPLTYTYRTYRSSKPNSIVATIEQDTLIVTLLDPKEGDTATITISAKDASACPTETSFTVSVNFPPQIDEAPTAKIATKGLPFEVNFTVTDDRGLATVTFSYREGGKQFIPVPMQINDPRRSSHLAIIPGDSVSSRGVEYRITTTDIDSARVDSGYGVRVRIPDPGLVDLNPPAGTREADYRLFSVPLEIVNNNALAVLVDDLGSYNKENWRFFALKGNNFDFKSEGYPPEEIYNEFEKISSAKIDSGEAFWLLINDGNLTIDTGAGISFLSTTSFKVSLNRGWNFIGNPFDFEIPIDNICLMSSLISGKAPQLYTYDGTWRLASTNMTLNRFEGFAIEHNPEASNPADTLDAIIINPFIPQGTCTQADQQAQETTAEAADWSIRILALRPNTRDVDNYARVSTTAASEHDHLDWPEPPVIGDYVSLYFPHKEWQEFTGNYTVDTRPEPADGETWDFEIKTQNPDKVDLSFEGLEEVPGQFEIWLIDEVLNVSQNLRENKTYSVAVLGRGRPRLLKLIVGNQDFTDEKVPADQILPTNFELAQNFPNPFNPATTIRYSLPRPGKVTLRVYNLLGEEVATLVQNEEKAGGRHFAIWDGRNQTGQPVSSGLYLYRLQAGKITIIKKMALLK